MPDALTLVPNNKSDIIERMEYMTDVHESWNGTEQRIGLRDAPLRFIEYGIDTLELDKGIQDSLLFGNIFRDDRQYYIPIWQDYQAISAGLSAGANAIVCNTTDRDFYVAGYAIIMDAPSARLYGRERYVSNYEVLTLAGVNSTQIGLNPVLANDWAVGSVLVPARVGWLEAPVDSNDLTDRGVAFRSTVRARLSMQSDFSAVGERSENELDTFDNSPLLIDDRITGIMDSSDADLERINGITGVLSTDGQRDSPLLTAAINWRLNSRADVDYLRNFFNTVKGRRLPFWLPTWSKDLVMTEDSDGHDTELYVRRINYYDNYTDAGTPHDIQKHIIFMNPSTDEYMIRTITSCADPGTDDEEVLTLQNAMTGGKTGASYWERICFLHYCRLMNDGIDIHWNPSTAEVSTTALFAKVLPAPTVSSGVG